MLHHWQCSKSDGMGLWVTWFSGRCSCPWHHRTIEGFELEGNLKIIQIQPFYDFLIFRESWKLSRWVGRRISQEFNLWNVFRLKQVVPELLCELRSSRVPQELIWVEDRRGYKCQWEIFIRGRSFAAWSCSWIQRGEMEIIWSRLMRETCLSCTGWEMWCFVC